MKFKKWVTNTLTVIAILSVFALGSDAKDLGVFIIVHLIATATLILSSTLLLKYGNYEN